MPIRGAAISRSPSIEIWKLEASLFGEPCREKGETFAKVLLAIDNEDVGNALETVEKPQRSGV